MHRRTTPLTKRTFWAALATVSSALAVLLPVRSAWAAPAKITAPCAVIEGSNGDSLILDRTRTKIVDVEKGTAVACGSWVSVSTGWVKLKHRNGYQVHLSAQTFAQFLETEDHVVLYKGQLFAVAGGGAGEMRILTANARARVSRGRLILSFNHAENETQLIALENSATLENRFADSEHMVVKQGEASSLNIGKNRVVPSIPAAVAVAELRPKMMALHLSEAEQADGVEAATLRRERKFASAPSGDRAPASALPHGLARRLKDPNQYRRHQNSARDQALHSHFTRKLAGGEEVGSEILYPDRYYGKTQRVQLEIEDPAQLVHGDRRKHDAEKQRLIRELSQIRIDQ